MAQFYHEPDIWLFGGIYEVLARHADCYEVSLTEAGEGTIEPVSSFAPPIESAPQERISRTIIALLRCRRFCANRTQSRRFPGYDDIDLSFQELESLVKNARPDWMSALESIKGIYLINDIKTGKRYVGSAYGDQGIWSRWCAYVGGGHGGNVELRALVSDPTLAYCRTKVT